MVVKLLQPKHPNTVNSGISLEVCVPQQPYFVCNLFVGHSNMIINNSPNVLVDLELESHAVVLVTLSLEMGLQKQDLELQSLAPLPYWARQFNGTITILQQLNLDLECQGYAFVLVTHVISGSVRVLDLLIFFQFWKTFSGIIIGFSSSDELGIMNICLTQDVR